MPDFVAAICQGYSRGAQAAIQIPPYPACLSCAASLSALGACISRRARPSARDPPPATPRASGLHPCLLCRASSVIITLLPSAPPPRRARRPRDALDGRRNASVVLHISAAAAAAGASPAAPIAGAQREQRRRTRTRHMQRGAGWQAGQDGYGAERRAVSFRRCRCLSCGATRVDPARKVRGSRVGGASASGG